MKKQPAVDDVVTGTEARFDTSERAYTMRDSEAPQEHEEKPLRFFPPAYVQRYVAVTDVLNDTKYRGKLRKVIRTFLFYFHRPASGVSDFCFIFAGCRLRMFRARVSGLFEEHNWRGGNIVRRYR